VWLPAAIVLVVVLVIVIETAPVEDENEDDDEHERCPQRDRAAGDADRWGLKNMEYPD